MGLYPGDPIIARGGGRVRLALDCLGWNGVLTSRLLGRYGMDIYA